MALRSYSVLDIYCLPLSSLCKTAHRHWTHVNVCRVSCWGVSNMLLLLLITFYFQYNIWGCICSTGPFQLMWLKGYICSSCCYHHQSGSIHLSHCYHIFPWLWAWDFCYIMFCHLLHIHSGKTGISHFIIIVQFMVSANSRLRFGLQIALVCLNITPSHHQHSANFS